MPSGPRIVEEGRRPREHEVQLGGEEDRAEPRQEPSSSVAGREPVGLHPRLSLVPSLATLFRVGFAAALLLTVQGVSERLAWRTNGLPFGTNYAPSAGRFFVQDFASIFGLPKGAGS